jgi:hypothetical protein
MDMYERIGRVLIALFPSLSTRPVSLVAIKLLLLYPCGVAHY